MRVLTRDPNPHNLCDTMDTRFPARVLLKSPQNMVILCIGVQFSGESVNVLHSLQPVPAGQFKGYYVGKDKPVISMVKMIEHSACS